MIKGGRKPKFDLVAAQQVEPLIGTSCARRALISLGWTDPNAARRHIRKLFKSLTIADFAHVEIMRSSNGKPLYGDVYGKHDDYGVWFIKLTVENGKTIVILSCHEAEYPLELACGIILKGKVP